MPKILVKGQGVLSAQWGENLWQVLQKAGIPMENPCHGRGTCGKCKVKLVGARQELDPEEVRFLSSQERAAGHRLACYSKVLGDLSIELPQEAKAKVLETGYWEELSADQGDQGLGIALDIGTTTLVAELVDLATGRSLGLASAINPQKQYGLDVLTRISFGQSAGGLKALQDTIRQAISKLIQDLAGQAGLKLAGEVKLMVAANPTMAHILLGEEIHSLGRYPYEPAYAGIQRRRGADLGLPEISEITVLPHVSAFIGSDVVAGLALAKLDARPGNVLYMDIGTNGELVLKTGDRLLACSCAAGPALEGMNISHGCRAQAGAIEEVSIDEAGIRLKTIDDERALGICGSGILAGLRELLRVGLLKPRGVLLKPEELRGQGGADCLEEVAGKRRIRLSADPAIYLTQKDIRQVQLAKGAILSGCLALLDHAGLKPEDLAEVLIAGQFGAHLSTATLVEVGLVPAGVKKISYLGNTAKNGAKLALLKKGIQATMDQLARSIEYVELATKDNYEGLFRQALIFPESDHSRGMKDE